MTNGPPLSLFVVSDPQLKMGATIVDGERMTFREGAGSAWLPLSAGAGGPAEAQMDGGTHTDGGEATPAPIVTLPVDLPTLLRELEDAYIRAALAQTHSNKKEAAKLLGLGRTTLVEKLRRRNMASIRQRA
jgi:DNA-binding NtrC family response regulator